MLQIYAAHKPQCNGRPFSAWNRRGWLRAAPEPMAATRGATSKDMEATVGMYTIFMAYIYRWRKKRQGERLCLHLQVSTGVMSFRESMFKAAPAVLQLYPIEQQLSYVRGTLVALVWQ